MALWCYKIVFRCSTTVPVLKEKPADVTWPLILHAPGGSGPGPAVAPVLLSLDPDCTAGPSPVPPAAAHPLESGSPCSHPWSSPGNPTHLQVSLIASLVMTTLPCLRHIHISAHTVFM